jgi:hypothetical protein
VKRTLLLVCLVLLGLGGREAHADPAWWQQFYARFGYRASLGLDRMNGPSMAIGYRVERGSWAVDLAAADIQQGLDEGVHEIGHLSFVRRQSIGAGTAWLSLGAGYSIARGWAECELPLRRGSGVQLGVELGYDLPVSPTLRAFGQVGVGVSLYDLRDTYASDDSATRIVPISFAIGGRF